MHRITIRFAAVLAAGSLLALAACAEVEPPEDRLAAAADATRAAGTAAFSVQAALRLIDVDVPGRAMSSGEGVVDFTNGVGRLEMKLPAARVSITMLFGPDFVHVRLPEGMAREMADVEGPVWIRGDPDDMAALAMGPAGGLGGDPTGIFRILDARTGDIVRLGPEEVGGVSVEGFGFTVRSEKLRAEAGERAIPPGLEFPAEIWLDSENRVRRMVVEMDIQEARAALREAEDDLPEDAPPFGPRTDDTMVVTVTTEIHEFGVEVDVEPPEDAEFIDVEEVRKPMAPAPPGD